MVSLKVDICALRTTCSMAPVVPVVCLSCELYGTWALTELMTDSFHALCFFSQEICTDSQGNFLTLRPQIVNFLDSQCRDSPASLFSTPHFLFSVSSSWASFAITPPDLSLLTLSVMFTNPGQSHLCPYTIQLIILSSLEHVTRVIYLTLTLSRLLSPFQCCLFGVSGWRLYYLTSQC